MSDSVEIASKILIDVDHQWPSAYETVLKWTLDGTALEVVNDFNYLGARIASTQLHQRKLLGSIEFLLSHLYTTKNRYV